jgi:signal transduction histidine kinase
VYWLNLWLRAHPWVTDVVLIALLVASPPMWTRTGVWPMWVQVITCTALVLPLLWRRRYPNVVAAIVLIAAWAQYLGQVWERHLPPGNLAPIVVLYTLVVLGRRRVAALVAGLSAAFFTAWTFTWYAAPDRSPALTAFLLMHVAVWLLGEFIRARRAYIAEVEQRAELAQSERQALARAAVAEERTRIARELHDVLAHSVSVIVVNAEGAKLVRHTDPAAVERTLDTISTTGRAALAELRRLLEMLHPDHSDLRPQPTLADLQQLVSQASTGRPAIELRISGTGEGLPVSAAVQAYRIVQEALTNVIKHAPSDASARVTVDFGVPGPHRRVQVEVTNTGDSPAPRPAVLPSSQFGLAGMRERVAMFDGTLDAGPTPDGGYRLIATLPMSEDVGGLTEPSAGWANAC